VPSNFWRRNGTAKNSSVNLEEPDERLAWLLAKRSMMLVDVIEKEHSAMSSRQAVATCRSL